MIAFFCFEASWSGGGKYTVTLGFDIGPVASIVILLSTPAESVGQAASREIVLTLTP
jgi:hypothetical protein